MKDSHKKAVSYLLSKCQDLPIMSILTYGSFARGDYKPNSDIDLLVVVDSLQYCAKDLKSLIKICENCKTKFHVVVQMDIMLDSEIDLWNKGILLDGHSFIDLSFYNKDGKIIFGEDIRQRFKLPPDFEEKARLNLEIIEAEFKLWFCHSYHLTGESLVPHWMTGWLLATFLNSRGIVEITSFGETCKHIHRFSNVAETSSFKKFKAKRELTPDEFINLHRMIKTVTAEKT